MRDSRVSRHGARWLGLLVLALAVLLLAPGRASAATLTVCPSGCAYTTIADALTAASSGDTIVIGAGTYSGGFTINKSVRLLGAGAGQTTISGGGPVVTIAPNSAFSGQVVISGMTITGGNNFFSGPFLSGKGGGIFNSSGNRLVLTGSVVSGNASQVGGGIVNCGGMELQDVTVSGNTATASGGGIANAGLGFVPCFGVMLLKDSTVSGNTAGQGGGIFNSSGNMTLEGSTVSGNTATFASGGGIINNGYVTLKDSTVSGNSASILGGGIFNNGGTLSLTDSAVSNNTAFVDGGGIFNNGGTLSLTDSAVSGNTPDDCVGC